MHLDTKVSVALKELERIRARQMEETRVRAALAAPATRRPLRQTPEGGSRLALARISRWRFVLPRREEDLAEAA